MSSVIKNRRRLLFLTVNSSFSHSSLALALLHSACQDLQWEWLRYDMTIKEDVMTAVRAIHESRCGLLVTDLYLFNRQTALEVLQRYHTVDPGCRIAAGGPECLGEGAEGLLREYPWLDCVFRGEGEEIFREYLENFDNIPHSPGRILPSEGNGIFKEWISSPYPVNDPFFVTDKPFVQMETSRGCPMRCFYCTSGGTLPRYRSLEQIREELSLLETKGVRELRLLDRTFNLPQERGKELLQIFRKEFPQMHFHLELHPQFLNESLRDELSRALPGQLHIEAGIQCLDQEVQRLSGRNSDVTALLDGLKFLCSQKAFETHADLLAGLPGQKWEHILADTAALMQTGVTEIQLEVLKVLPGTPLRRIAPEHGLKYNPVTPYDVMMTNTISLEEMQKARDLSRLLDMTWNHKHLHQVMKIMDREMPDLISSLLKHFLSRGGNPNSLWDLKKRFLFLLEFCSDHQLKKGAYELAFQWLLAGFPPGQGADIYSEKSTPPPPEASLMAGSDGCLGARDTRYYVLSMPGRSCYFAFNRGYSLNTPAGIWEIKDGQ